MCGLIVAAHPGTVYQLEVPQAGWTVPNSRVSCRQTEGSGTTPVCVPEWRKVMRCVCEGMCGVKFNAWYLLLKLVS